MGRGLAGAQIEIRGIDNVKTVTKTAISSGTDGMFYSSIKVIPNNINQGSFKIGITEKVAPNGYAKVNNGNEVILEITYNTTDIGNGVRRINKIETIEPADYSKYFEVRTLSGLSGDIKEIKMKNDTKITPHVKIVKKDFDGNYLSNVGFDLYFENITAVKGILNGFDITMDETNPHILYVSYGGITFKFDAKNKTVIKEDCAMPGDDDTTTSDYTSDMKISQFIEGVYANKETELSIIKNDEYYNSIKDQNIDILFGNDIENETYTFKIGRILEIIDNIYEGNEEYDRMYKLEELSITRYENNPYLMIASNLYTIDDEYNWNWDEDQNIKGKIRIDNIIGKDTLETIYMTIKETKPAPGYSNMPGEICMKWDYGNHWYSDYSYDSITGTWNSTYSYYAYTWQLMIYGNKNTTPAKYFSLETKSNPIDKMYNNQDIITIKNQSGISKLTLLKLDSQDPNVRLSAKFELEFENVKSIKGHNVQDNGKAIIQKFTQDGELKLEDLVIKDPNESVFITIRELQSSVGYKYIDGDIKFEIKDGKIVNVIKDENVRDDEFNAENDVKFENGEIKITLKNVPIMNLGGIVWEDSQTGVKEVAGPDGIYNNNEKGIAGVKVELYKSNGELVTKDVYGYELFTKTASAGAPRAYKAFDKTTKNIILAEGRYVFPNIEKGNYYIRFTYDGINYQTVNLSSNLYAKNNESKVSEEGRDAFNAEFTTISKDAATGGKEGNIALSYEDSTLEGATVKTSSLITKDANGNVLQNYVMRAKTSSYLKSGDNWKTECWNDDGTINMNTYAQDINCGLTKRNFDLAVGMDVDSAKLSVNGKETIYNYNQIINSGLTDQNNDLNLDEWLNNNIAKDNEKPTYNLYLYRSDYNYRIKDYITDGAIKNNVADKEENVQTDASVIDQNVTNENEELRAFITYKVILKNQSAQEGAKVNELAYYYDNNYIFVSATKADGTAITFANDTKLPQIDGKTSARVSGFEQELGKDNNYRQELYFTFEVKEDANGFVSKDIECANIVEILSYSTTQGLIDKDSTPGNMISNGSIRFEDDTDQAKGIKLSILNERERTITGTVFEDTDKDGTLNNTNTGVNDVIVQLIEIKKIGGKYYEYIWQETKSGSNQVKTIARNGYEGETYTNNVQPGSGKYEFKDFIPGNYIIRFIYGDGKTYDVTDNVKIYNGQDYKSTKDPYYNKPWYNTAGYEAGQSVARDNEARRLEVMSYSTTIDETNGAELTNKTDIALENTWMCAETSRINIPVDAENLATTEMKTESSVKDASTTFENVNFGLALRPETNIVLEKHITALKITPSGIGAQSIVDAKADIENIANEVTVNPTGITQGLATIKSTAGNRGFWQVATDVEELMQGAELEVEYTYVIENNSEEDYLNKDVLTEYYNNIGKDVNTNGTDDYAEYLKGASDSVDTTMKNGIYSYSDNNNIGTYLGQFYYTGDVGSNDKIVSSRVDRFEEALNNDFAFNNEEERDFKVVREASKENIYGVDKTNGPKETTIDTVIENTQATTFLVPNLQGNHTTDTADWSRTVKLTTTLSTVSNGKLGANLPSHIAEILKYSNAAGRKDMKATPANLSYVHSDDTTMTLDTWQYELDGTVYTVQGKENIPENATNIVKLYNEQDEFWAESIIITKPTGEDKLTPIQIVIITISAIATLGIGIVLIKKYVLKK